MSKKVPVYLSKEEIKTLLKWFSGANSNEAYWNAIGLTGDNIILKERLEAELATFEE